MKKMSRENRKLNKLKRRKRILQKKKMLNKNYKRKKKRKKKSRFNNKLAKGLQTFSSMQNHHPNNPIYVFFKNNIFI